MTNIKPAGGTVGNQAMQNRTEGAEFSALAAAVSRNHPAGKPGRPVHAKTAAGGKAAAADYGYVDADSGRVSARQERGGNSGMPRGDEERADRDHKVLTRDMTVKMPEKLDNVPVRLPGAWNGFPKTVTRDFSHGPASSSHSEAGETQSSGVRGSLWGNH